MGEIVILFLGVEDVVFIDMVVNLGKFFCVFSLDMGCLYVEMY